MSEVNHPARPARLIVTGGWYDSPNAGDNALLLGIIESLGPAAPATFTALSPDPPRLKLLYDLPALAPRRHPFKLLQLLRASDALVFTGGAPFFDHRVHMAYCAVLTLVARAFGVPVIFFAIWLRPLHQWFSRQCVRFICRNASYLSGRDRRTMEGLAALSDERKDVRFLPDPASMMSPIEPQAARALLVQAGIDPGRKTIAICLRDFQAGQDFGVHHYDCQFTSEQVENYRSAITELVRWLLQQTDYAVVFLPMHTVEPDDDRVPAQQIAERFEASLRSRIVVVAQQYGAKEMKGLLGLMDAVIGVRFHSLLLASSMRTPIVSIAHASKNESLMDLLGQPQYLTRLEALTGEWLIGRVQDVMARRDAIVKELDARYTYFAQVYNDELRQLVHVIRSRSSHGAGSKKYVSPWSQRPARVDD